MPAEERVEVTADMVMGLQEILRGGSTLKKPAAGGTPDPERFRLGHVWYGDWQRADRGRFGSPGSPSHFAVVTRRKVSKHARRVTLGPVTSKIKRNRKHTVLLPRGVLPGVKFCQSQLLLGWRLMASRPTLDNEFKHRGQLPSVFVDEIAREMSHV